MDKERKQSGFSIIEMAIFSALMGSALLALVAFTTATIKQSRVNYQKIYATRYAEDALEWLRVRREDDWDEFYDQVTQSGLSGRYCLNTQLTLDTTLASQLTTDTCPSTGIVGAAGPKIYSRSMTYQSTSPTEPLVIEVIVQWRDGQAVYTVPLRTSFNPTL